MKQNEYDNFIRGLGSKILVLGDNLILIRFKDVVDGLKNFIEMEERDDVKQIKETQMDERVESEVS